jgi:hypothetical protein
VKLADPIPAHWVINEVTTAISGDNLSTIKKKGINKTPPPIPTDEAAVEIRTAIGKTNQY